MDASIVVSLRIDSARNFRPSGNREVPRVGHGGRGHSPPGAGRCQWASCGLLVRCLGSAVPSAGFFAGSMSFPQGSLWRERPPPLREGKVARGLATLPPARGAPAPKNWGSLSPPAPLSCGAPLRQARAGHARRSLASLCRRRRGKCSLFRVQCGVSGKSLTTPGRAPPSEREALWLSKACATYVRHQVFVSGALIRRHRLDPQRRKSSIIPAPAEAAVAFNGGPITAASLPPVARLSRTFCLPLLHRIRRSSSPITFKTQAMAAHLTLM